jgi:acyl-CoA thioester hydrolase
MAESDPTGPEGPLHQYRESVRDDWIDYNGHMNVAYYTLLFDHAGDAFVEQAGISAENRAASGGSIFSVEAHISYIRELNAGDPVRVATQLLAFDAKRIHLFQRMVHAEAGYLAATNEVMDLYVDLNARKVAPMPDAIQARLAELHRAHRAAGWPEQAGRAIRSPETR